MKKGFTLVETLVAISLLCIAVVAPMELTVQSLASAYYARDQITAYYLAQEGLEEVHQIVDGQILQIAEGTDPSANMFGLIPVDQDFRIDATQPTDNAITLCSLDNLPDGVCEPLRTDSNADNPTGLYGYNGSWVATNFTRTVIACYVQFDGTCTGTVSDEIRVAVTVSWQTGAYQARTFTLSEDFYRWVVDGSGT